MAAALPAIAAVGSIGSGAAQLAMGNGQQQQMLRPQGQLSQVPAASQGFGVTPPPLLQAPQHGNLMDILKQYSQR